MFVVYSEKSSGVPSLMCVDLSVFVDAVNVLTDPQNLAACIFVLASIRAFLTDLNDLLQALVLFVNI